MRYTWGVGVDAPPEKFLKIGPSETPYPAFTGSNAINSYVYFVELFSESRYSWFPSRRTKIHDSQVFKTKIHDSCMFCYYDSWFVIPLPPPKFSTGSKCQCKNTELKNVGRFLQLRRISECCGLCCYVGQLYHWSPYSNPVPRPVILDPGVVIPDPTPYFAVDLWSHIPTLSRPCNFSFPLFLRAAALSVYRLGLPSLNEVDTYIRISASITITKNKRKIKITRNKK